MRIKTLQYTRLTQLIQVYTRFLPMEQHYLTSSGIYTEVLNNLGGCDSVVTLNLTINNSSISNSNIIA